MTTQINANFFRKVWYCLRIDGILLRQVRIDVDFQFIIRRTVHSNPLQNQFPQAVLFFYLQYANGKYIQEMELDALEAEARALL